jgi:hypothetical protein
MLGILPGSWTVMPTNAWLLGRSRRLADRIYPTEPNSRNADSASMASRLEGIVA